MPGSITAWNPSIWIIKRFLDGSTKNNLLSFMFLLFIASEGLHQRCIFKVNRSATLADFSGKTRGNCRSTPPRHYKELKHGDEVQHHINAQSKFQPPKNEKSSGLRGLQHWHGVTQLFSEMADTPNFFQNAKCIPYFYAKIISRKFVTCTTLLANLQSSNIKCIYPTLSMPFIHSSISK